MSYPERMKRAAEGQTAAYVRQLAASKRAGAGRRSRRTRGLGVQLVRGQTSGLAERTSRSKRDTSVRAKPRTGQLAAALAFAGGAAALAGLDPAKRPAVAAAIAARARRLGSRRVGGCPTCGRPVRSDEDRVQLEGSVFHTGCALRTQGE